MAEDNTENRGRGLAARLRAALDFRQDEERRRLEEVRRQREIALRERDILMKDLGEFGRSIGHLDISARRSRVVFKYQGRKLCFEIEGDDGAVLITGDGLDGENHLYIQQPLGKWVWSHAPARGGADQRQLLFDKGLEALITRALGIRPLESPPLRGATDAGRKKRLS